MIVPPPVAELNPLGGSMETGALVVDIARLWSGRFLVKVLDGIIKWP